jgi:hypothetical protein
VIPEMLLPGLDSLLETCQRLDVPVELAAPSHSPLTEDEVPNARPLDPYLRALYARLGGMVVGRSIGDLQLYRRDGSINGLKTLNDEQVSEFEEPFRSVLAFAGTPGTLYCFALVPWLADEKGVQPVILIDPYEEIHALPIASSLDQFFKAYARCLEFVVANPWSSVTDVPHVNFWSLPEELAKDRRFVEMLSSGRFSALMKQDDEARAWVRRVVPGGEVRLK